jgi:hypothetical protein
MIKIIVYFIYKWKVLAKNIYKWREIGENLSFEFLYTSI